MAPSQFLTCTGGKINPSGLRTRMPFLAGGRKHTFVSPTQRAYIISGMAKPSRHHVNVPSPTVSHPTSKPRGNTNTSRLNVTHGNKNVSRHANTSLQSLQHGDTPSAGASASGTIDMLSSDDGSDSDTPVVTCVSHGPKSHKKPTSSKLGFYKSHWYHILSLAKLLYRYEIHTDIAFPERNDKSMTHAHDILLESIAKYLDRNKNLELDTSKFLFPCSV